MDPMEPSFEVEEVAVGPTGNRVRVGGRLSYRDSGRLKEELQRHIRVPSATSVDLAGLASR